MSIHLRYPKLQTVRYSNLLLGLCHQARTATNEVIFDLTKTEFITPFGIILLSGTISECLMEGKRVKYTRPAKAVTRKFLSGIGFNNFFKISDFEHKIESTNVQLKRIHHIDYLLTDQILDVFKTSIRMSDGVIGSLKLALNELMTNAFDHSESAGGCYVCVQSYRGKRIIRLCIADFGIGILTALRTVTEYRALNSDYAAIKLAVQEGVTSRIGKEAGYGLTHINRFAEVNQGKMHILSGSGKVTWDYSQFKKRRGIERKASFPFNGTIINITINADREGYYFLRSEDGDIF